MAVERQSSALPTAQPSYILRGHTSPIHETRFVRQNSRLLTGDADGWIIYWKLETKRARAVWKAHDGAILCTAEWGRDKIITHGRDNNLRIWQLRPSDEVSLSTTLPAEGAVSERPKPWLLHTLPVNTLNFCAFSMCNAETIALGSETSQSAADPSILVAVPARDDQKVEVYQFPQEKLRYVVPRVHGKDNGMVMAVKLVRQPSSNNLLVVVGYEGGMTAVHRLPQNEYNTISTAELVYMSKPHTQPILSLDASPDGKTYYTSSADATIAAHRMPELAPAATSARPQRLQDLPSQVDVIPGEALSPEERFLRTIVHENSSNKLPLPSPTSTDDTAGTLTFSKQPLPSQSSTSSAPFQPGGLSSLLSTTTTSPSSTSTQPTSQHRPPQRITLQDAYKITNTRHSGQQSLRVRSDGRLLLTGGWDTRVRMYSTKTLKEVAVLKWHKEGVYAVDFSTIIDSKDILGVHNEEDGANGGGELVKRETGLGKFQRQREEAMQMKHWVVAGAKDGKVSLWEVF